ncbi:MAG: hypothetical protein JO359_05240 [Candidatus Eremiobacteraeota bacterium]|nr:hypothetical protein [Candidatus Eremiobacteraeota bacterium]
MYTIDGTPACLLITENLTRVHPDDGERHFYPAFVKAFEPGFTATDWDYGTDYAAAKEKVDAFNAEHGINKEAMKLIVTSSMFPAAPITVEQIFKANGEDYVAS